MKAAAAALAGAGLGLFGAVSAAALASAFWPLVALGLCRLALVAGATVALAAGLAPAAWRERLARHAGLLALAGCAGAAAALLAIGPLSRTLHPGPGLGLFSFPAPYIVVLALPFAAAGAALATWCVARPASRGLAGSLLVGAGGGVLAAALLAGKLGAALPVWAGGRLVASPHSAGRVRELAIDRGLRRLRLPPRRAELAFPVEAGAGGADILVIGLANPPVLAHLLALPGARITILESDAALAREAPARWPALAWALANGKATIRGGAERWALASLSGRYDLIAVGEGWTPAAQEAHALSHRRDHRWTVEAFAACLRLLKPGGRLLAQRAGVGRVASTLREAAGLPAAEFGRRVVLLWRGGPFPPECWYAPAGLDSHDPQSWLRLYRDVTHARILYSPTDVAPRTFYAPLVKGARPRGMDFSTPLDLSPAIDARPFFDDVERVALSPRLPALPAEAAQPEDPFAPRLIPASDRALWLILAGGLAAAGAVAATSRRSRLRRGAVEPGSGGIPADALWRGAAAGLAIEAFAAWSEWMAPGALAAAGAQAALLAGLGAGWAFPRRGPSGWRDWVPAAVAAVAFGAVGYRVLPAALRLGPGLATAAAAAAGALLGAALGRALGAGSGVDDGTAPARCGAALAAAVLAALAGALAATHFGYPFLWVLGAVALLAPALRGGAREAVAAGTAT